MQQAPFSLEDYFFKKVILDFDLSSNNSENDKDGIYIKFDPSGVFDLDKKTYELTIEFRAYSNKTASDPFVYVKCLGLFKFVNIEKFEDIPSFFYRNSVAILFPYVRAYISLVTNQANTQPLVLPTLNLVDLEKPLRENTTIGKL